MTEEQPTEKNRKTAEKLATILLVILIIFTSSTIAAYWIQQSLQPRYKTSYTSIGPQTAEDIINNTTNNLTIVDTRFCKCSYDQGHIPNAIWNTNPINFYNTTSDLLIYCHNGTESITFCKNLINHTYGAIYHLEGGIQAWENAGYEIT